MTREPDAEYTSANYVTDGTVLSKISTIVGKRLWICSLPCLSYAAASTYVVGGVADEGDRS